MIHSLADYNGSQNNNKRGNNSNKNTKNINLCYQPQSFGKCKSPQKNNYNAQNEKGKFQAFRGKGRAVSQVNSKVNQLKVNKFVVNKPDKTKPTCKIDIRLFNGVVVTANFNLTSTVRDIKNFVERKSGSHNFSLLEGFPPKPLTELNKTIEQLKLQGTMLTQKIK